MSRGSQANGKNLRYATHQDAVMSLLSADDAMHLVVRHDPQPPGLRVCFFFCCFFLVSVFRCHLLDDLQTGSM